MPRRAWQLRTARELVYHRPGGGAPVVMSTHESREKLATAGLQAAIDNLLAARIERQLATHPVRRLRAVLLAWGARARR